MKTNETRKTKKEFYKDAILELMEKCNDLPLLDLMYRLLCKSF